MMSDIQERLSTLFDDIIEETEGCTACKHYGEIMKSCDFNDCIVNVACKSYYKFEPKPEPVIVYGVRFKDGSLELFETFFAANKVYQQMSNAELIAFKEEMK